MMSIKNNEALRLLVLLLMILAGLSTVWFGFKAIEGDDVFWVYTAFSIILTPYFYGVGRNESVVYSGSNYLRYFKSWILILVVVILFASSYLAWQVM
jgi:hypothetical protein